MSKPSGMLFFQTIQSCCQVKLADTRKQILEMRFQLKLGRVEHLVWQTTFDQRDFEQGLQTTLGGKKRWRGWCLPRQLGRETVPCFARFNEPELQLRAKPNPVLPPPGGGWLVGLFSPEEAWWCPTPTLPAGLSN